MNKNFLEEYLSNRDFCLETILEEQVNWNKFINFWARHFDKHSIDNILTLYSYNPSGSVFYTFDEWNSEKIDRRIKPKSKGVPILDIDYKSYVFDIRQTYGKEYKEWKYYHIIDNEILEFYKDKYKISFESTNIKDDIYNLFHQIIHRKIKENYNDLKDNELKFIVDAMTSLFLSKNTFNINHLKNGYNSISSLSNEDILKCMQVINKEVSELYNEFSKDANKINRAYEIIRITVLNNYIKDSVLNEAKKEDFLETISEQSKINYGLLNNIYSKFYNKYAYINKKIIKKEDKVYTLEKDKHKYYVNDKEVSEEEYNEAFAKVEEEHFDFVNGLDIDPSDYEEDLEESNNNSYETEQLSLFEPRENQLANKICDIFNSFDTKYQNTFTVDNVELQKWEHISSKKRNLSILLKSPIADYGENAFSYFNSDKTDEIKLNDGIKNNAFIQSLYKDKDFSIYISPDLIHIYWNNFDDKQFDLNMPSLRKISQEEIDEQELDKIDKEVSYKVEEFRVIPTNDGVELTTPETTFYDKDGVEIEEEKIPSINYHISDSKIDNSFGAKSRFENNIKAIELLKNIEKEDRNATKEEQDILANYVGWGGISDAFDERKDNWNNERERLKNLLSDEEYKDARKSTTSSFYTPNIAIDGIYKALEKFGFKKGNILEPSCGIGNFFGRLPDNMQESKLYGIEIDSISGRIAKKLYPNSKIQIIGYEESNISDNLFDIVIGNVPFGSTTVYDKRYKEKFKIHDYFFQKSLDKVRNGGIIAFITTDGTLDKKDKTVREYIAKRAELVGAIRLPNNTFTGNANTKVTTDIIFLKKRNELKLDISDENWVYTSEYSDGITINNYFIDNPSMMLGKMDLRSSSFGMENTLNPLETPIEELMNNAINILPSEI